MQLLAIDTACSSSLVALHTARLSLLANEPACPAGISIILETAVEQGSECVMKTGDEGLFLNI